MRGQDVRHEDLEPAWNAYGTEYNVRRFALFPTFVRVSFRTSAWIWFESYIERRSRACTGWGSGPSFEVVDRFTGGIHEKT